MKGLLSSLLLLDDAVELQRGEDRQRVEQALDALVRVKVGVNFLPGVAEIIELVQAGDTVGADLEEVGRVPLADLPWRCL